MKKIGGILAASAIFSAVFSQNFTFEEAKISGDFAKNFAERESKHFSIIPTSTRKINRYFICNCENIEIPYDAGLKILRDYKNYENRFRYIIKSDNTSDNNYFFILGIPLAKTWLWGSVNEKLDNNKAQINFVQTKTEINYSDSVKSMVVIDFEKLVLQWDLVKIDEKNSRFCLTGVAEPQKPVPEWLVKTALKKVIPRTLNNLKNANSK